MKLPAKKKKLGTFILIYVFLYYYFKRETSEVNCGANEIVIGSNVMRESETKIQVFYSKKKTKRKKNYNTYIVLNGL